VTNLTYIAKCAAPSRRRHRGASNAIAEVGILEESIGTLYGGECIALANLFFIY